MPLYIVNVSANPVPVQAQVRTQTQTQIKTVTVRVRQIPVDLYDLRRMMVKVKRTATGVRRHSQHIQTYIYFVYYRLQLPGTTIHNTRY